MILMLIKHQFLKRNHTGQRIHLNTLFGYNDNGVIRPICLKFAQMAGYAKEFNENATMPFKANNKQLLKKL